MAAHTIRAMAVISRSLEEILAGIARVASCIESTLLPVSPTPGVHSCAAGGLDNKQAQVSLTWGFVSTSGCRESNPRYKLGKLR
jgi:hypothetical protein